MGTTRIRGVLVFLMATLLVAGCASTETEEPDTGMTPDDQAPAQVEPREPTEPPEPARRIEGGKLVIDLPGMDGTEELAGVVYFDFDQAIVKRGFHEELDKHAAFMAENRGQDLRLEGHADERGTREYNLALGERRANAVRAYLVAQGVSGSQIEVISYGEERPAVDGNSEAAWAKNRRVELEYTR